MCRAQTGSVPFDRSSRKHFSSSVTNLNTFVNSYQHRFFQIHSNFIPSVNFSFHRSKFGVLFWFLLAFDRGKSLNGNANWQLFLIVHKWWTEFGSITNQKITVSISFLFICFHFGWLKSTASYYAAAPSNGHPNHRATNHPMYSPWMYESCSIPSRLGGWVLFVWMRYIPL